MKKIESMNDVGMRVGKFLKDHHTATLVNFPTGWHSFVHYCNDQQYEAKTVLDEEIKRMGAIANRQRERDDEERSDN